MSLLALAAACHRTTPDSADEGAKVSGDTVTLTAEAARGITVAPVPIAATQALELPGRLVWNEDATVRVFSPFAGRVERIAVQPGDRVTAGQTLAELSSADYGSAQSDLQKAQAALVLAQKAQSRQRDLLVHGVAAQKDVEQAESDYATAESEAKRAQARLKLFGDNGAAVDQNYHLKSPIAGVVVEKTLNPGQEVLPDQAGAPLFVVTDPTALWMELDAHEGDLRQLKLGQKISLHSAEYPDESFDGALTQIADFVDPVTRAIRVRGAVGNADRRLKGEMYVTAALPIEGASYPQVPAASVVLIDDRRYVFVATGETSFVRRLVKTGTETQGRIAVTQGLAAGDRVVTDGTLYLQQLLRAATAG